MRSLCLFVLLAALTSGCRTPPYNLRDQNLPDPFVECAMHYTTFNWEELEAIASGYEEVIVSFCRFRNGVEQCADLVAPTTNFYAVGSEALGIQNPFGLEEYNTTFQVLPPTNDGAWKAFFCGTDQCLADDGAIWLHFVKPLSFNTLISAEGEEEWTGQCWLVRGTE